MSDDEKKEKEKIKPPYASVLVSEFLNGQDLDYNLRIYGRDFYVVDTVDENGNSLNDKPPVLHAIEDHPMWEYPGEQEEEGAGGGGSDDEPTTVVYCSELISSSEFPDYYSDPVKDLELEFQLQPPEVPVAGKNSFYLFKIPLPRGTKGFKFILSFKNVSKPILFVSLDKSWFEGYYYYETLDKKYFVIPTYSDLVKSSSASNNMVYELPIDFSVLTYPEGVNLTPLPLVMRILKEGDNIIFDVSFANWYDLCSQLNYIYFSLYDGNTGEHIYTQYYYAKYIINEYFQFTPLISEPIYNDDSYDNVENRSIMKEIVEGRSEKYPSDKNNVSKRDIFKNRESNYLSSDNTNLSVVTEQIVSRSSSNNSDTSVSTSSIVPSGNTGSNWWPFGDQKEIQWAPLLAAWEAFYHGDTVDGGGSTGGDTSTEDYGRCVKEFKYLVPGDFPNTPGVPQTVIPYYFYEEGCGPIQPGVNSFQKFIMVVPIGTNKIEFWLRFRSKPSMILFITTDASFLCSGLSLSEMLYLSVNVVNVTSYSQIASCVEDITPWGTPTIKYIRNNIHVYIDTLEKKVIDIDPSNASSITVPSTLTSITKSPEYLYFALYDVNASRLTYTDYYECIYNFDNTYQPPPADPKKFEDLYNCGEKYKERIADLYPRDFSSKTGGNEVIYPYMLLDSTKVEPGVNSFSKFRIFVPTLGCTNFQFKLIFENELPTSAVIYITSSEFITNGYRYKKTDTNDYIEYYVGTEFKEFVNYFNSGPSTNVYQDSPITRYDVEYHLKDPLPIMYCIPLKKGENTILEIANPTGTAYYSSGGLKGFYLYFAIGDNVVLKYICTSLYVARCEITSDYIYPAL